MALLKQRKPQIWWSSVVELRVAVENKLKLAPKIISLRVNLEAIDFMDEENTLIWLACINSAPSCQIAKDEGLLDDKFTRLLVICSG